MRLQTPVDAGKLEQGFGYKDKILFLGSCFADEIGRRCRRVWLDSLVNPFGVLFNPCSVADSLRLLESDALFSESDVLETPVGFCSIHHHTSFARQTVGGFLDVANSSLDSARSFYGKAGWIVVTLGTAFVYRHLATGQTAANCLKLPRQEFERSMLDAGEVYDALAAFVASAPERQWVFTVSPVRHIADGLHQNQLSKAALLCGVERLVSDFPNARYFPAYEIVLDELRDYRFYAEDMAHPTAQTAEYVFERFVDFAFRSDEQMLLREGRRVADMMAHRPLLPGSAQAIQFEKERDAALAAFLESIGREKERKADTCPEY